MINRNLRYLLMLALASCMAPAAVRAQAAAPDTGATAYLRPGDVVKLWIWREEGLSGEFPVPETGIVVFPKIGAWNVTKLSMAKLKEDLRAEYLKYLRNPSIELTFLRRVSILGAVREPGLYPVDETMSVASVLALAGGTTQNGRPDEVQLFRDGQKLVTRITQRTRLSDLPLRSGDQLYVPERSWLARNTPLVSALISGVVSVAIALIVQNL
ncbi:MAG: polysaccharide biosynthesis/export family protein [Gemmatimonadota bacterium]